MRKIIHKARTAMLYLATLLLVGAYPMMTVSAEETPAVAPSTSTAATPPVKPKPTYTYDEKTGRWNSNVWVYNATTGDYEAVVTPLPSSAPPAPATIITPSSGGATAAPTTDSSAKQTTDTTASTTTGAGSSVDATAKTGDAAVIKNTTAGSAASGDASSTATMINTVNSMIKTGDNQKAATFVADITGDVTGDIVLQPMLLKAMLEANASTASTATTNNQLTNTIDLSATSGNATVGSNTKAGDAKTGSANTVADVVNIINSMVAANQSFIGTVNIYGNLNGDILIAPDFIPQLLASNGGGAHANTTQVVNATDTQSIVNNVSLAAESGQAAVLGNTKAGSASTGDAKTNLVIFNLSGHDIVAANSLLVFVNVLGTWVGVIVDAPAGATAAAIGNGVTTNTVTRPDLVVNTDTTNQITNNINLQSKSGDALVTGNTRAGDATSGDATASANIANISNSQIGLTGWFGILYINVFGGWLGSFGIDTPYGTVPTHSVAGASPSPRPVEFVPHGSLGTPVRLAPRPVTVIAPDTTTGSYQQTEMQPATLTSAKAAAPLTSKAHVKAVSATAHRADYRLPVAIASMILIGGSAIGFRRLSA